MQSVSSRIWTRVAVSISYDDNHYPTGTWNHLTVHKKRAQTHLRILSTNVITDCNYKDDLALNNLQWLIYHKTQQKQIIYT